MFKHNNKQDVSALMEDFVNQKEFVNVYKCQKQYWNSYVHVITFVSIDKRLLQE